MNEVKLLDCPSSVTKVLSALEQLQDSSDGIIATQSSIAEVCNMSLNTVKRAMCILAARSLINTHRIHTGLLVEVGNCNAHKKPIKGTKAELWKCNLLM